MSRRVLIKFGLVLKSCLISLFGIFLSIPCNSFGQSSLSSSYENEIDKLLVNSVHSSYKSFKKDKEGKRLCKFFHLSVDQLCYNRVFLDKEYVGSEHFLNGNKWFKRKIRRSLLSELLKKRNDFTEIVANRFPSSLSENEIRSLVLYGTRNRILKEIDSGLVSELLISDDFYPSSFETMVYQIAKEPLPGDIDYNTWVIDNADFTSPLEDAVDLNIEFLKLLNQAHYLVFEQEQDCPNSYSNISAYCASNSDCEKLVFEQLARWTRDCVYGTDFGSGENKSFALRNLSIADPNINIETTASVLECNCDGIEINPDYFLDIPGGNILVGDKFILIGRDELERGFLDLSCPSALNRLKYYNIPHFTDLSTIENAVTDSLESFFDDGRKIYWLGNELRDRFQSYETLCEPKEVLKGYTPFYHIDLSFMLVGPRYDINQDDTGDNQKFQVLVGKPSMCFQKTKKLKKEEIEVLKKIINRIRKHTDSVLNELEQILQSYKYQLDVVELPVLINVPQTYLSDVASGKLDISECRILDMTSYVNGLVTNNASDDITFYMPNYRNRRFRINDFAKFFRSLRLAKRNLKKAQIQFELVPSSLYKSRDGLRCKTVEVRGH